MKDLRNEKFEINEVPTTSSVQQNLHMSLHTPFENVQRKQQPENIQRQPHTDTDQHMDSDIISMLQSGTGFQMNFHTQPEDQPKSPHLENKLFVRNFDADMTNMLHNGSGFQMDYRSHVQQHIVCDQTYGKHFKGDMMIDIGNNTYCRKKILDMALGSSHKSTHIARKLLEGVFKMETILSCTLTGIAPRAQGRERMSMEVVQLDLNARKAIVEFAVRIAHQKGWTAQSTKLIERAMSQRIGEIKRLKHHS